MFYKKNTKAVKSLYNYAFKYINAKDESEILDYPISVSPNISISEYKAKDNDALLHYNVRKCIECGLCAYSCTSKIHVTDYMRKAKKQVQMLQAQNGGTKKWN